MDYQIAIIGTGAVGLAIAAELSKYYQDIVCIEKHVHFGNGASSRNSEVIHAGIYYPDNSLKAKLCVEGNSLIYEWCQKYNVAYQNSGKLIIATSTNELEHLHEIHQQGRRNGLDNLQLISQSQISKLEPNIYAIEAINSTNTGIIDSHQFMQSLENFGYNNSVTYSYNSEVVAIEKIPNGYELSLLSDKETFKITSEIVINAAGLYADKISEMLQINTTQNHYSLYFARGHYFRLSSKYHNFVTKLIYPVPDRNWTGIGIHITKDLNGYLKLGPDVEYLPDNIEDYSFNYDRLNLFYEAAKRYIPQLQIEDLTPDQTGIRAKLQKEGEPFRDFIIKEESSQNLPNFINLIGIESPGLTSSLAISRYVKKIIEAL